MISRDEFNKNYDIAQRTSDREAQYKVGKYYLEPKREYEAKDWLKKSADRINAVILDRFAMEQAIELEWNC